MVRVSRWEHSYKVCRELSLTCKSHPCWQLNLPLLGKTCTILSGYPRNDVWSWQAGVGTRLTQYRSSGELRQPEFRQQFGKLLAKKILRKRAAPNLNAMDPRLWGTQLIFHLFFFNLFTWFIDHKNPFQVRREGRNVTYTINTPICNFFSLPYSWAQTLKLFYQDLKILFHLPVICRGDNFLAPRKELSLISDPV